MRSITCRAGQACELVLEAGAQFRIDGAEVYAFHAGASGLVLATRTPVGFLLNGSPVNIVTQMPNCEPGATPVMYANLRQAYTLVNRSATTMVPDPYTAQFCHLFKFECRVGGGITCPNAARLLRVK